MSYFLTNSSPEVFTNLQFTPALLNLFQLEAHFKCGIFFGAHHSKNRKNYDKTGRIQDFHGGGGGCVCKWLCAITHITSAESNSHSAGVQGPLNSLFATFALEVLGLFYCSPVHSDKKLDLKTLFLYIRCIGDSI